MNENQKESPPQLPLFPADELPNQPKPSQQPQKSTTGLIPQSALNQAIGAFEGYMQGRGFTENTQQAFRLDMEILSDYIGPGTPLSEISTVHLQAFLDWMQDEREAPCSPKTLERRITTLKVFFGWLAEEEILPRDTAAPLIHHAVSAPLPDILTQAQIAAVTDATQAMRRGDIGRRPDARPHLLVTLVLHTGIKKSECVDLQLNHIDLTNAERPAIWIRYKQPSRQHKERRIPLPKWWPAILRTYREQYTPRQHLFPWTARNLEYVLTGVAEAANVPRLTFEMLRWTCAVRDYREGMEPDALRRKLGLSEISWYEVEVKLALLAQQKDAPGAPSS
jgi:integrase/recombinase XerD